jgi:hypothetical protein
VYMYIYIYIYTHTHTQSACVGVFEGYYRNEFSGVITAALSQGYIKT